MTLTLEVHSGSNWHRACFFQHASVFKCIAVVIRMHRWRAETRSVVAAFVFSMPAIVFFRLECCLGFDHLHATPLPLPLGSCAFA